MCTFETATEIANNRSRKSGEYWTSIYITYLGSWGVTAKYANPVKTNMQKIRTFVRRLFWSNIV